MTFWGFIADNYLMIFELVGLLIMLRISSHISARVKRLTIAVVMLLFASILCYSFENWTQTFETLSIARPLLTAAKYSLYPIILMLITQVTADKRLPLWKLLLLLVPIIICVPIFFTSQWTHIVFYFYQDNHYAGGLIPRLPYFLFSFYGLYFLLRNLFFFKRYSTANRIASSYIIIAAFAGALVYIATNTDYDYTSLFTAALLLYYLCIYIHQSRIDPLTSLLNRQSYYQDIANHNDEINGVVSVDMNGLKQINDGQGHEAGDIALRTVSQVMWENSSRSSRVYRIGGDEFVILYIDSGESDIRNDLDRIREKMAETPYVCAFGYAMRMLTDSIDDVLRRADHLMYEDKSRIKHAERSNAFSGEELTGLPLWSAFFASVQSRFNEFREGWCLADICVDRYKLFVDWYGLDVGRALLKSIGERVGREAQEVGGCAGYLGQEEFCIVVPYDEARFAALRDDIQEMINASSRVDGFSPVIGISMIDGSCDSILQYFNNAALAVDDTKGTLGSRILMYDVERHRRHASEYEVLFQFRSAIKNGEITFFLQPQVRVSTGKIVGAEALVRWKGPNAEWRSPLFFVPVLEKYGLITELDKFVWESVCKWIQGEKAAGRPTLPVSVNVSQIDISTIDMPQYVSDLVERYGLTTGDIQFEVTETACISEEDEVADAVSRLRAMGFVVLMDDFGSAYSSLNLLRRISVDVIKLDAKFLRIREDERRRGISIIESVVNLTKNLSVPIIVEGVEYADQVSFLHDLGCRYMQGFYFYKPMDTAAFTELISNEDMIDTAGFLFKPNQQLRTREFLDQSIYSDSMLNNVLGPVAFYNWHGDEVDIVRFNEQFYEAVGIGAQEFEARRFSIQRFMPESDRAAMYELFRQAERHWGIGTKGNLRAYRPNGMLICLELRLFFLSEDASGKRFYASAKDVTELQTINSELPGAYFRCAMNDEFDLLYISEHFCRLTGFDEKQIKDIFGGRLADMIHPDDIGILREQAAAIAGGSEVDITPYRIRTSSRGYIYIADQRQVSDRFGEPCWQCMAIDVNEVMILRNYMNLLARYMVSEVILLRFVGEQRRFEVVVHGLGGELGMDSASFTQMLDSGDFFRAIGYGTEEDPHEPLSERFAEEAASSFINAVITLPDGKSIPLEINAERVDEGYDDVRYLIVIRHVRKPR